ncbi:MAG: iron-sulfur cluster assembly accessory protein, partial [Bdellovibrio sp.]|nr:iron-sulfur cluster assembly accessory protein [Bdellovibrio sp.]
MIQVTEKAVSEIKRIQEKDPTAVGSVLRVMVVGGGCSGMSYKLGFDNQPVPAQDKVFEKDGVKVVCDPKSYLYLSGT